MIIIVVQKNLPLLQPFQTNKKLKKQGWSIIFPITLYGEKLTNKPIPHFHCQHLIFTKCDFLRWGQPKENCSVDETYVTHFGCFGLSLPQNWTGSFTWSGVFGCFKMLHNEGQKIEFCIPHSSDVASSHPRTNKISSTATSVQVLVDMSYRYVNWS